MPHLVEMHNKHAKDGLVVITVSVDPPNEKDLVAKANGFLNELKPPFLCLHLNESDELWSKKLDFTIPPCYFIFDRHGKWVRYRGADYDDEKLMHRDIEQTVLRLLSEK
ncbi:MAG TPA: hypothetical protein VFE62_27640 [Gemmataceae bacterium]|nr:hypothetical protein [Gemmataceae bacterium]